jgi:hypothetical protein
MDDQKVNLFLSLMAYAGGSWSAEEVISAYEYLRKEAEKPIPEGKVRLFKAVDGDKGPEIH